MRRWRAQRHASSWERACSLAPLRKPAVLAKQVATLDYVSGGRAILGLGVGSRQDDFEVTDIELEHRGGRSEEVIGLLRKAWSGEPVQEPGKVLRLRRRTGGPVSRERAYPDLDRRRSARPRCGASRGWAMASSAALAEGWSAIRRAGKRSWTTPEEYGRDPATHPQFHARVRLRGPGSRPSRANVADFLHYYYGPQRSDLSSSLVGPADGCVEKAKEFLDAGPRR